MADKELLKAKCAEWQFLKEVLKTFQASERELRLEILGELFNKNSIGAMKTMVGDMVIKGTFGLEHKVDSKQFEKALASDMIPDEAMDGIRTKYELDKKGYDNLDPEYQVILDDYITSKPTMPTLEIQFEEE